MKLIIITILLWGTMIYERSEKLERSNIEVEWFEGIWLTKDFENSTIKIYKAKNGFWYGKVLTSNNPKFLNKLILKEAIYDDKAAALIGVMYHPEMSISIDATLTKETNNQLKLVGKRFLITKTFYWTKK